MKEVLELIVRGVDILGIGILCIGLFKFLFRYIIYELQRLKGLECVVVLKEIRLEIGSYILLALEIMIISDIIHGSVFHTLEDLYSLGLLVIIRTAISYFLGLELKELRSAE